MTDAIKQLAAFGLLALLLRVAIPLPTSAAEQGTTAAPSAPKLGSMEADLRDRPDDATEVELTRRRFDLIKEVVPRVTRVAVVWQPGADIGRPITALQDVGRAASALGLNLQFIAAVDIPQLEAAFSEITTGGVDAILVLSSRMLLLEREYIVQLIAKTGLPAVYDARAFVENGGLMSYGSNLTDLDKYNTRHVEKITEDAPLQIDRPIKLELVVNLTAARKLGLSFNPELLRAADEVIE